MLVSGPDVAVQFADDPLAAYGPLGPRDILLDVAKRTDAIGPFWFGYAVIVAEPPRP
jgi:hypothetical protein